MPVELVGEQAWPRNVSGGTPNTPHSSVYYIFDSLFADTFDIQVTTFMERVRLRDQICVISGLDSSSYGFAGVQAAHIVPRSHSQRVRAPI